MFPGGTYSLRRHPIKTLDRNRTDLAVRELESDAYRLALALASEPASSELILLEAFSRLAPSLARIPGIVELRHRLHALVREGTAKRRPTPVDTERSDRAVVVGESLHLRIVDLVEEAQSVEPMGRRKAAFVGAIGVILVGALMVFFRVHSDALAAAQPTIRGLSPGEGARDVPVSGQFRVTFGRLPAGTPILRLNPATGKVGSAYWDGSTLVADYSSLKEATRYELVLTTDYRSTLQDRGRYTKRWTLTTETYAIFLAVTPSEGQLLTGRVGQISVLFSHPPTAELRLSLVPAGATIQAGHWSGKSWTASYSGLRALTRYRATVTVDYGVASANISRQWTFTTEPGAPPLGVPVLWYSTTRPSEPQTEPRRMVAIDWHGKLAGTIYLTVADVRQTEDGSSFIAPDGSYLDRNGVSIASSDPNLSIAADDSTSICALAYPGGAAGDGPPGLFTGPIGGPMRRVAMADWLGAPSPLGIFACSVAGDRAVVGDMEDRGITTSIRVIALSTGRILYQQSYAGLGARIASSRDGRYLAEQTPPYEVGQLTAVTMIRRTADGRVVARIDTNRVVGFSSDGTRVVTVPYFAGPVPFLAGAGPFLAGTGPNNAQLVDWQTGKILWTQTVDGPVRAMAEPNGTGMAIAVANAASFYQLWLVAADGHATQVVNEEFYPAFGGP